MCVFTVCMEYLRKVAAWQGAGAKSLYCSQAVIGGRIADMAHIHLKWGDVILCSHTSTDILGTACELAKARDQYEIITIFKKEFNLYVKTKRQKSLIINQQIND